MDESLRAFLARLIDYAGLFPPADLPIERAIRSYAGYRAGPDAWMLGRFVCPAGRLAELDPLVPLFAGGPPLELAALGRRGEHADGCLANLQEDLQQVAAFRERHGDLVAVEALELPLPPTTPEAATMAAIAAAAAEHRMRAFCEMAAPPSVGWEHAVDATLDAILEHNAGGGPQLGYKLRAGGATPDAIPSVGEVAHVLLACRDRGVALKCTAGLHRPFRGQHGEARATMHGFVNVFAAGVLAHACRLERAATEAILADEEPASFTFAGGRLAWRDCAADAAEVARLRETALVSFGSCSFDEPREDLRRLGVLES